MNWPPLPPQSRPPEPSQRHDKAYEETFLLCWVDATPSLLASKVASISLLLALPQPVCPPPLVLGSQESPPVGRWFARGRRKKILWIFSRLCRVPACRSAPLVALVYFWPRWLATLWTRPMVASYQITSRRPTMWSYHRRPALLPIVRRLSRPICWAGESWWLSFLVNASCRNSGHLPCN